MKYELWDITTADVAFIAYGKSLEELMANSAYAMFDIMVDLKDVEPKEERVVEVEGEDYEEMLFNFLNELLVFYGAENLIFSEFEVKIDGNKLKAVAKGEVFDENKHKSKIEVKAATYHKMRVWQENGIWKASVILDI